MNKTRLKKYASLIARVGANVQKGQEVVIYAELDQPEFVKMVVDECYKAGAKFVSVEWDYQPISKLHYRHCSKTVLGTVHEWQVEKIKRRVEVLPASIYLISEDPDGLAGVNQEKLAYAMRTYISTFIGQFLDNFIFSLIVFVGFAPIFWSGFSWTPLQCATCALTGAIAELIMEIIFSPIGYNITKRWRKDGVGREYLDFVERNKNK